MTTVRVRRAVLADADAIAEVHVRAWREAYDGLLPAGMLAGLEVAPRTAGWARIIRAGDTDVLVAKTDAGVVGWAATSEGRDDDRPVAREVEGIYVLARFHGSGAGQLLLEEAVGEAAAYLWMLDGNARAEAFYRRNRFERDGVERDQPMSGRRVHVVRMTRS